MSASDPSKRRRHLPQPRAAHVYWSERADGSKVFEVRHPRNGEGKRLFEVVGPRLDQAKARARELYGEGAPRPTSVGRTLNDVIAEWQRTRQLRSSSVYDQHVRLHIAPQLGRRKVRDLDKNAILAWLSGLKREDGQDKPLAESTKRLIFSTLSMLLSQAVEMGAIGTNPCATIQRKQRPKPGQPRRRILSPDEEIRLLAYCGRSPWLRPIITVSLYQALRLGEVLGLQWDDLDFARGKLHVRHALSREGTLGLPKAGKPGTVDLMPQTREVLLELRQNSSTGYVFTTARGLPRGHKDVQRAFSAARTRAALPVTDDGPVVFHSLRHTGISRLANHPQIPLVHVRDFARHANLATTQGYVHRIESEKITRAMAEALGGVREDVEP